MKSDFLLSTSSDSSKSPLNYHLESGEYFFAKHLNQIEVQGKHKAINFTPRLEVLHARATKKNDLNDFRCEKSRVVKDKTKHLGMFLVNPLMENQIMDDAYPIFYWSFTPV